MMGDQDYGRPSEREVSEKEFYHRKANPLAGHGEDYPGPVDPRAIMGVSDQASPQPAKPKARVTMLKYVNDSEQFYLSRLAALQALKEEVNKASDWELERLQKFWDLSAALQP